MSLIKTMSIINFKKSSERRLIERFIISRNEADFRLIYKKFNPKIQSVALKLLRDTSLTEDVIQNTWFRAVKSIEKFKWQSAFSTWLIGIVINCCSEYQRSKKQHVDIELVLMQLNISYNLSDKLLSVIDLEHAIKELNELQRKILIMHDLEGSTHKQISKHCIYTYRNK